MFFLFQTNETSEVKLEGVHNVFHSEVVAAVQKFGKIKSVVLHRATEEVLYLFLSFCSIQTTVLLARLLNI